MKREYKFYEEIKDWNFSHIKKTEENLTNWDMYEILRERVNNNTIALDLGTGGCENVIKHYPNAKLIFATDYSPSMIETAKENVLKSGRKEIVLKVMDNLKMDLPKEYFDVVTARHTQINAKQIYECLKSGGILIVKGVDKLDCWKLKRMFGRGQGYKDANPISLIDYENILDAGFKNVELIPIHVREYYKTEKDLYALLDKTPIIDDYSEEDDCLKKEKCCIDEDTLKKYINENKTEKGILLIRRYYGIVAIK